MEFVAKKKTIKVTIEGKSYNMTCPTMGQVETMQEKVKSVEPEKAVRVYVDFFAELGLPVEASLSFDSDAFMDFITFVLSPKKSSATES